MDQGADRPAREAPQPRAAPPPQASSFLRQESQKIALQSQVWHLSRRPPRRSAAPFAASPLPQARAQRLPPSASPRAAPVEAEAGEDRLREAANRPALAAGWPSVVAAQPAEERVLRPPGRLLDAADREGDGPAAEDHQGGEAHQGGEDRRGEEDRRGGEDRSAWSCLPSVRGQSRVRAVDNAERLANLTPIGGGPTSTYRFLARRKITRRALKKAGLAKPRRRSPPSTGMATAVARPRSPGRVH